MWYLDLIQNGVPALAETAFTINRVGLGLFFAGTGYYKLFNERRHNMMMNAMVKLHIPFPTFNGWFVSIVEFLGGLSLISGILSPLAALGLFFTCLVAAITSAIPGIPEKDHPLSKFDYCHYVFYKVEVVYCLSLLVIVAGGVGWTLVDLVL